MRMPEKIEADMFARCGMNCMVCTSIVIIKNLVPDV